MLFQFSNPSPPAPAPLQAHNVDNTVVKDVDKLKRLLTTTSINTTFISAVAHMDFDFEIIIFCLIVIVFSLILV